MRLTPAEVHNVAFKKPSIGKRGYDEDEVDAFLDLVEDELARLIEENNELTAKLAKYESGELTPAGGAVTAPPAPVEVAPPVEEPAVEEPAGAEPVVEEPAWQETAPPEEAPAPAPAPAISTAEAHSHAARLLGLAQETADRLTAEAREEADRLIADARDVSDQILMDAQHEAENIKAQGQRDLDTILAEKASLEGRIEGLRTYEREYRSRLRSWITDQLNQLDGNNEESSTVE